MGTNAPAENSEMKTPENAHENPLMQPPKTAEYAGTVAAAVGALLLSGCVVITERPNYDYYPSRHYEPVREHHYEEHRQVIVVQRPVIVERKVIVVVPKKKKDENERHRREHDRKN